MQKIPLHSLNMEHIRTDVDKIYGIEHHSSCFGRPGSLSHAPDLTLAHTYCPMLMIPLKISHRLLQRIAAVRNLKTCFELLPQNSSHAQQLVGWWVKGSPHWAPQPRMQRRRQNYRCCCSLFLRTQCHIGTNRCQCHITQHLSSRLGSSSESGTGGGGGLPPAPRSLCTLHWHRL